MMTKFPFLNIFVFVCLVLILFPKHTFAQTFSLEEYRSESIENRLALTAPDLSPSLIPSLFLTPSEISLLDQASEGLYTRPPTDEELEREQRDAQNGEVRRINSVREVALGGILYNSSNDWAIWINGQKITPKNIPPAIIDITVNNSYVQMKWLDFQTNQIFPVRLRSNQRFNFDTRIFLPG